MSYLIFSDFKKQIQSDNLNQIIGQDQSLVTIASELAVEEAESYLIQRFNTEKEFTSTDSYDPGKIYYAGDRVYLNAPVYSAAKIYELYTLTLINGNVYYCSTEITVPEIFTLSHWTLIGPQYTLYYAPYPQPIFNLKKVYKTGDKAFWNDKVYTCVIGSILVDYDTRIQNNDATYPNIVNIFPDDPLQGIKYWGAGVDYIVESATLYAGPGNPYAPQYSQVLQYQYTATGDINVIPLPALAGKTIIQITNEIKPLLFAQYDWNKDDAILTLIGVSLITGQSLFILYSDLLLLLVAPPWVQGDNRSRQMVAYTIDIALYHLHSRISPRNIPELRVKRYDDAVKWLKSTMKGDLTAKLAVKQPETGTRVRWASNQKQENGY